MCRPNNPNAPRLVQRLSNKSSALLGNITSTHIEEEVIEVDAALEKSLDKDLMREWLQERGHEVPEEIEGIEDLKSPSSKSE